MKTKLFAGLALAIAGTAAAAQVPQWGAQPRDGMQTRAEVTARIQRMFARADLNRDGVLTQQEAQAAGGQMRGMREQRAFDPARRAQRTARAFARLDANRDGVISRQEFAQRQAFRAERKEGGARGQRMGMRGGMGGRMFAMADVNRDNRLTLQEATTAALQRFDRTDLNRDGQVTREERMQVRQQRRGMRG